MKREWPNPYNFTMIASQKCGGLSYRPNKCMLMIEYTHTPCVVRAAQPSHVTRP